MQAGRWASSGGNLHPHRFFVTRDPAKIAHVRAFSPGMLVEPVAIIAILLDRTQIARQFSAIEPSLIPWIDAGTAAQNMQNMAHALGLGSCPVTSFSISGVGAALGLPEDVTAEFLLILGHPKPVVREVAADAPKSVTTKEITSWETYGNHERG